MAAKFFRYERNPVIVGGRLTTLSGTPVQSADRLAQTSIKFAPYTNDYVPVFISAEELWLYTYAELSNDLTASATGKAGPAAAAANSIYDLFVWYDAGTIRLTRGPLWTSDVARSAGTVLLKKRGLWVNNVDITNGPLAGFGTYVGSFRTNAASQIDLKFGSSAAGGSEAWFGIWNMFNRVDGRYRVQDSTASYTYSTNTIRAYNNSNTNRVSWLSGLPEDAMTTAFSALCTMAAVVGMRAIVGVGLDTTTSFDFAHQCTNNTAVVEDRTLAAWGAYVPQFGFHFVQANERGDGANNMTFVTSVSVQGLTGICRW